MQYLAAMDSSCKRNLNPNRHYDYFIVAKDQYFLMLRSFAQGKHMTCF